jgi:hypothetical protein
MINPFRGAYAMRLPPQTYPGVFVPAAEERSGEGATFLRDGLRLLTRVDWKPGVAPAVEAGEYVVHDGVLVFSPPDGSDPRAGGHTFELGLPHQVGAPFYALLLALAGWCAAVLLLFAGRTASSVRSPLRSLMGAGTSDRLPIRMHR